MYTDTLNYAVYGEVSSKLVLAHRVALDVLDKRVCCTERWQVKMSPIRAADPTERTDARWRGRSMPQTFTHSGISRSCSPSSSSPNGTVSQRTNA
ncbi:hypothetical protein [Candidatus Mycobacterium methanotrophicum]|uniref:Uncharacterized protein n=1 Tax=Candidatus Mycobacterium methanotrophicum TaxID=2943498 RepID=A0ABY4QP71_9MYCO|nr:hypothetical protein [Candidatus Mycobacterium methanotrophicum]UQX11425.1 hypothetical protein M5I08_02565 [Candidatus Mycobacterium methanotrophicum]